MRASQPSAAAFLTRVKVATPPLRLADLGRLTGWPPQSAQRQQEAAAIPRTALSKAPLIAKESGRPSHAVSASTACKAKLAGGFGASGAPGGLGSWFQDHDRCLGRPHSRIGV